MYIDRKTRARGGGNEGVTANRYRVSFKEDENALKLGYHDGCATL